MEGDNSLLSEKVTSSVHPDQYYIRNYHAHDGLQQNGKLSAKSPRKKVSQEPPILPNGK